MEQNKKQQKYIMFVVIITSFLTTFTGSALNLSIPNIGSEFGASAALIGWIVTGYLLASAVLSVPFGRIADLTGRKRILVTGILIFSVTGGLSAFSWTIQILLLFRILQGVGAAMIFSTNIATLISAFPGEARGKVLGYSVASTYIGLSAGPVVGGFLNHTFGWRSIFLVIFFISFLVFLTAWRGLPSDAAHFREGKQKEQSDLPGNLLYISMLASIMVGLSAWSTSPIAKFLVPLGLLFFVLFVRQELRSKAPVVEVRLFSHNLAYAFSNLAALMNYGATFGIGYLLSLYLQLVRGYDSQIAGLVLISQPLIMAFLSPLAGRLSDRVSPFKLASMGMAITAIGVLSFVFLTEDYPMWLIIANLVVIGVGFAFFSSPNTNAVMSCVQKKDYSVASSILATMRSIGHTSSMAIVTFITAAYLGQSKLAEADPATLVTLMRTAFLTFAVICAAGIFIALKRKSPGC